MRYAILLAALLAFSAHAGEANLTWAAPTERTDGTPLDNLAGFRVLWGVASRSYTESAEVLGADSLAYTVTDLPAGTHYFAVTAFDADGLESVPSAEVSKTIPPINPPPNPPAGLAVTDGIAYALVQTADRIALIAVGTVPAGTACDPAQYVRDSNGLEGYVVPKASVVWAGTVRAEVVVAECG